MSMYDNWKANQMTDCISDEQEYYRDLSRKALYDQCSFMEWCDYMDQFDDMPEEDPEQVRLWQTYCEWEAVFYEEDDTDIPHEYVKYGECWEFELLPEVDF